MLTWDYLIVSLNWKACVSGIKQFKTDLRLIVVIKGTVCLKEDILDTWLNNYDFYLIESKVTSNCNCDVVFVIVDYDAVVVCYQTNAFVPAKHVAIFSVIIFDSSLVFFKHL